jgi:hypothetical protein
MMSRRQTDLVLTLNEFSDGVLNAGSMERHGLKGEMQQGSATLGNHNKNKMNKDIIVINIINNNSNTPSC